MCVGCAEGSYSCTGDYVLVYALRNGTVRPRFLSRFCGANRDPVFAQRGGIRIQLITDDQFTNRGFVADFFISRQSPDYDSFLADRTVGRAFGTVCRLSVVFLSVCVSCYTSFTR